MIKSKTAYTNKITVYAVIFISLNDKNFWSS